MSTMIIFALAGFVTYLLRASMTLFGQRLLATDRFESAVGFVSPAVLAAIVASAVFVQQGQITSPDLVAMLAVGGAFVAVRKTGNVGMALFVGLPIYWLGALAGLT